MTGLVVYLAGPGKSNEHENPHVVAGHESIVFAAPAGELSHEDAIAVASELDTARVVFGTEVSVTSRRKMNAAIDDGVPRSVALADATSDQNVWHCSLALNPEDGELSDEKWAMIAADFMKEMDFDDAESPRTPARWVAIRHGKTTAGGDHIHIAASAVREDGTKVDTFNDFKRAQAACNVLERRHDLVVLASREAKRGTRGIKPAEAARAQRAGASETVRESMERTVRACATASRTEAEFVRRLRARKLLVRPRYDKASAGAVVGYSVAATPTPADRANGVKPVWYGGGRLAKDLTLPRLRDEWDQSDAAQSTAAAEWSSARSGFAVTVTCGRERQVFDPELLQRASSDIETWNKYLSSIPVDDHAQWARAAGRTSGVFAAWSQKIEKTPGPLASASSALAAAAQIPAHQRTAPDPARRHAGGVALLVLQSQVREGSAANALLLRQLMRTMEAFADAANAAGRLQQSQQILAVRHRELTDLHTRMAATIETTTATVTARSDTATAERVAALDPETAEAYRLAQLGTAAGSSRTAARSLAPPETQTAARPTTERVRRNQKEGPGRS